MDFFEDQQIARRKTGRLILLFVLAVICIVALVYFAAVITLGFVVQHQHQATSTYGYGQPVMQAPVFTWWRPMILLAAAVGSVAVIGLSSLYRISQLQGGGSVVATSLGGRLLDAETATDKQKQLLNVVEEMAIASGTAVPAVYLLPERGINAFAAGFSPNSAVIAVTQGALETLSRDELEGVIGHEFSHILNGDMRLNIRLIGVLFGIIALTLLGSILLRAIWFSGPAPRRSNDGESGGQVALAIAGFGLLLIVIGYIGTFFARLIQAAVSRQREFLADASAVQFTRNPEGIAGALKKIGGYKYRSKLNSPHMHQVAHMCFGQAFDVSLGGLFATHPPLAVRIKRIEPSFDGAYPQVETPDFDKPMYASRQPTQAPRAGGAAELAGASLAARIAASRAAAHGGGGREAQMQRMMMPMLAGAAVAASGGGGGGAATNPSQQVGRPTTKHLRYAGQLIQRLPEAVQRAAREPFGARAVVYGLILDQGKVRDQQLARLQREADAPVYKLLQQLLPVLGEVEPAARLPLLDLTVSSLRKLSPTQYEHFKQNVGVLIQADEQVDLFEWVLQRTIIRRLDPHFYGEKPVAVRYRKLTAVASECATLLSALAWIGAETKEQAARAFEAAAAKLEKLDVQLLPAEHCTRAYLDKALIKLAQLTPGLKRQMIDAACAAIAADKRVTIKEAELLRAMCDSMDAPMPPVLVDDEAQA